ncbi:MAG: SapC family protein [Pseudomonadales bacterium]|nr:SapC family protein [Pseudomonadales bacterium]
MSKQLLMYENVAPLNKTKHRELYVKPLDNFNFAKDVNSAPLTLVEFPAAAAEYTIVFIGTDEQVMPAVILGFKENENRYFSTEQGWNARYIPAFIRRYPFVFSSPENGDKLTLCLDENYAGCNQEGRGERLFDADGEQTQYLKNVLGFMEEYQAHYHRTQAFCKRLVELELLQPMSARFGTQAQGVETISGFRGIDRAKLKQLPSEVLAEFVRNDWLELIYLHLHSIRSFGEIMAKVTQADTAAPLTKTESESTTAETV